MKRHIEKLDPDKIRLAAGDQVPPEVIILNSTESLMNDAAELAGQGYGNGTILIAEEQTAGRGRRGRTWESRKSLGLYFAVVLFDEYVGAAGPMLSIINGLTATETVRAAGCDNAGVKWPNDVFVGKRKIAGVLIEKPGDPNAYIVGIGVNVHHRLEDFSPELRSVATSIYIETEQDISRNEIAGWLIKNLINYIDEFHSGKSAAILTSYKDICVTLGKKVEVVGDRETYTGIAGGLTADGALIVNTGKERRTVYAGDVNIIR